MRSRFKRHPLPREAPSKRDPERSPAPLIGVYRARAPREGHGEAGEITATDRHVRHPLRVPAGKDAGAETGELVIAEPYGRIGRRGQAVRITTRLGRFDSSDASNVVAIQSFALPHEFAAAAQAEAAAAGPLSFTDREDLRALPLITIDGEDARDFDDAVFAERAAEGFRIIVAIADVAHYVREGSTLDEAARERGNSVYLPGRVVPMLPRELSEHWCSLVPGEDRGVFFAEIIIDPVGRALRHRFALGVMRSAARLTYRAVQSAWDQRSDAGLPTGTLAALKAAWQALEQAREARGVLEIELPERRVVLDASGHVAAVQPELRFTSHRLIEEFMIAANVAAAEELIAHRLSGIFRVHASPSPDALAGLATSLRAFGVPLGPGPLTPTVLRRTLAGLGESESSAFIGAAVVRALPPAGYSTQNTGHFGLALASYTHFTSPIRRYADLLVHRALLSELGPQQPSGASRPAHALEEIAQALSFTEHRAADAERSVLARADARLLAKSVGKVFEARISGVTRGALFVALAQNGAEGVVPLSSLGGDLWRFDQRADRVRGVHSCREYALGSAMRVQLIEADPIRGRLLFRPCFSIGREPRLAREEARSRLR